jgi:hypothetical protein
MNKTVDTIDGTLLPYKCCFKKIRRSGEEAECDQIQSITNKTGNC